MLDFLFSSDVGDTLTLTNTLIIIASALALGLLISLIYIRTHKSEGYVPSFTVTLIMLPAIIAIIILLVGNNVARAFSLAGAFSLIRFRSAPGDSKDIAYVFFTLAIGLACGMGYVGYAALFAIILCAVMLLLTAVHFAAIKSDAMMLKITVPENLNYQGLFDEVLAQYTFSHTMKRVKTSDFGALFEVTYHIQMKQAANGKEFIDALRCRNGNLNITLTVCETEERSFA